MTRWSIVVTLCLAIACSSGATGGSAPTGASGAAQATAAPTAASAPTAGTSAPAASDANPYLAQPGQPLTPVKVATCAVSGGFIQLYTAIEAKLFEKYGMQVELTNISGSGPALAAMTSGDIHFLYCAADATIPGMASGAEVKLVADPLLGLPYVLITRPDVKTVQDLKGKSLGVARVGDLSDRLSRLMVEKFGLRPNEDVDIRPIGGSQPERYQGLLAGVVGGIIITPPLEVQARKDGLNVVYELSDMNLPFIYSAVHAPNTLIRDNPQLVQRFVAAMADAVYFTEKNPDVARAALQKVLKLDDPESLDSAYNAYAKKLVNRRMTIPLSTVNDAINDAREQGTQVTVSGPEAIATNQFVDELDRNGFLQQLWDGELPPK
ncbi:MAG TPA: ABC transporter substrate-binding protein [Chloroflexota bacterium]|nr:ABC transporter substrate-binding protein [Chloroflexota bacterium]